MSESPVPVLSVSESPPPCLFPVLVLVPWFALLALLLPLLLFDPVVGGGMVACVCEGAW